MEVRVMRALAMLGTGPWRGVAAVIVLAGALLALRPWSLRWGATRDELARQWPGDELTPRSAGQSTRAITIHASAPEVWAWIVQIGQDRGGFYSYTWLENLFGCKMHNADRVVPEFQSRSVGDTVWLTPKERYGGRGRTIVAELIPDRAMIMVSPDDAEIASRNGQASNGTWGLVLDPIDAHTTRLIVCTRGGESHGLGGKLFAWLVFDPAHFIMERKMMLGIKQRAEREARRDETERVEGRRFKVEKSRPKVLRLISSTFDIRPSTVRLFEKRSHGFD